ncbi:DUF4270 domain-containing protein [Dyadobacter sp. CY345]|uniref:DUF4270 family protein n=1 Tax=Dyadobacter sp. CY345 TaxID=2909335 RepID=UPI001F19AFD2|nr:DUF4270 family protein [Dyadobacter sp. CY345]MCF2447139.1 DUF4270 domain-containing protein [Dyadobacter sp. CY345]
MKFTHYSFKGLFSPVSSILAGLYLCVSLSGCQSGDEINALEQTNPDDFQVLFSDTTTVKLSTVAWDSTMTGGAGRMLIGRYVDPFFGNMQSAAYFQPTLVTAFTLPEKAVYDSLVLKLPYDTYYYGDTTKTLNFSVHTLQADILVKSSYFNNNTTTFDKTPIGKKSFRPSPNQTNSLRIKLDDVLGKKVFDQSVANLLTTNEQWINIVKGLVVMADAKDNASVLGFKTSSDSTLVELHYHTEEKDGVSKAVGTFKVTAEYNQILADRAGTELAKLPVNSRTALPSEQSGNKVFIQGGVGLMARADFPTLRGLKDVKYSVPNRAFLRITPYKNSVVKGIFGAPPVIHVYYCDKNNQFITSNGQPIPLSTLGGTTQPAAVVGEYVNDLFTNTEYYEFDVSSQFTSILASESADANGLLFITSALGASTFPETQTEFSQSLTRLVIGDQKNAVQPGAKLLLYYTTLKP